MNFWYGHKFVLLKLKTSHVVKYKVICVKTTPEAIIDARLQIIYLIIKKPRYINIPVSATSHTSIVYPLWSLSFLAA